MSKSSNRKVEKLEKHFVEKRPQLYNFLRDYWKESDKYLMIFVEDLTCLRIHFVIRVNTFTFYDSIAAQLSTKFQERHEKNVTLKKKWMSQQITRNISLMNVYYQFESSLFDCINTEFVFYDQISMERPLKGKSIRCYYGFAESLMQFYETSPESVEPKTFCFRLDFTYTPYIKYECCFSKKFKFDYDVNILKH